jgi:hypothetical protein
MSETVNRPASAQKRPAPLVQYSISEKGVASLDANAVLKTSQVRSQLSAVAELRKSATSAAK